jgi:hypothetical protein
MTDNPEDRVDRLIQEALAVRRNLRAPEGFAERFDARLFYARLIERQRLRLGQAWAAGLGGAAVLTGVAALFVQAVDVPAWIVENVPGVLGRLDAVSVRLGHAAIPLLLTAAGGVVAAATWTALRMRTRRARADL